MLENVPLTLIAGVIRDRIAVSHIQLSPLCILLISRYTVENWNTHQQAEAFIQRKDSGEFWDTGGIEL